MNLICKIEEEDDAPMFAVYLHSKENEPPMLLSREDAPNLALVKALEESSLRMHSLGQGWLPFVLAPCCMIIN